MKTVPYRQGQSVYDLCLQVYGTLDRLVDFCKLNGITNMGAALTKTEYQYDPAQVKYQGNKNIYVTGLPVIPAPTYYLLEEGSFYVLTEAGDKITLD